jgi:hypothetical protein
VANVANSTNIPLQDVTYQYWFNGPDGVTAFDTSSPMDLFELQCSDATTGAAWLDGSLLVHLCDCPASCYGTSSEI